ncbi:MTOR-associated protein MEAK7 [Lamellibrachia satsuma]|nr:MTOR-associated protein MEAK7 [Lamellibrachia satsuma]
MGNKGVKQHKGVKEITKFNDKEQKQIKAIFDKICGRRSSTVTATDTGDREFDEDNLKTYAAKYLTEPLIEKVYLLMKHMPSPSKDKASSWCSEGINIDILIRTLSVLLKGSVEEKAHVICFMATSDNEDTLELKHLRMFTNELICSYEKIMQRKKAWQAWCIKSCSERAIKCFSSLVLHDMANYDGKKRGESETMPFSVTQLEKWLQQSSLYQHLLNKVFYSCFPVSYREDGRLPVQSLLPRCEDVDWNKTSTMLDLPAMVMLNHAVEAELRDEWRFLFSSNQHGESFFTLLKHIINKGPTLLIVRDKQGYIFGGYSTVSLTHRPRFVGSEHCFLFSLAPSMAIYHATGLNENYVYLNTGQETLPNGLGMGGQLEYFGMWLDSEYGKGHSKGKPTCTTFSSPQLSASEQFEIDELEAWGIGPEPCDDSGDDSDTDRDKVTSILDKDMESKAMLELLDRGPVSEGLRESDNMADTPGVHALQE